MHKCSRCYFSDQCSGRKSLKCGYFTPVEDEDSDSVIMEMVEQGRDEYDKAYRGYLDAFYND